MTDNLPLAGRGCVVTGGSRGIGAAIVRLALAQGADVVFGYHSDEKRASTLVDELRAAHPDRQCSALQADVADGGEAERFATEALDRLGRLDVLVNNAGITRDALFARMRPEQWHEVIGTNLDSMYTVTRPLLMPLVKQRGGAVINITSSTGLHGVPGQTAYAAAKAGVIGFTKSLAKEIGARGVTVNAVAPGLIETDMTAAIPEDKAEFLKSLIPSHAFGSPDDVAHLVCYLASEKARYITGQVIEISGGLVL
ncbi:SDR family oxidoreductase [Streptantibioticus ferralitis]|uniref:SDR family NAD(P)-dependent oxidoreductase n=1 Tax=Streptantibioticus ferralitis TaxID=236510 RepID=A0ABT5ZBC6_9ACTN|nr:SDR family NAD(P)-dependent oxidoreductase [Streptantibioticus ferralitis]MDF2260851.1 SDR family NAD(P)-dependent oxidoreductase [Streptantibioticus ferralitis]